MKPPGRAPGGSAKSAAHVRRERGQRVVLGEPALEYDELAPRIALVAEEQQPVVVRVAAAKQGDAGIGLARREPHVRIGRQRVHRERVELVSRADRRAAVAVAADHALLLSPPAAHARCRARSRCGARRGTSRRASTSARRGSSADAWTHGSPPH
jgi:hypothetical protein